VDGAGGRAGLMPEDAGIRQQGFQATTGPRPGQLSASLSASGRADQAVMSSGRVF
jgi:hypothetical protein